MLPDPEKAMPPVMGWGATAGPGGDGLETRSAEWPQASSDNGSDSGLARALAAGHAFTVGASMQAGREAALALGSGAGGWLIPFPTGGWTQP